MFLRLAIGKALKEFRISRGIAQNELGGGQGQVSNLERGIGTLTVEKLDDIAGKLDVHPLAILAKGYLLLGETDDAESLIMNIKSDLEELSQAEVSKIPLR